MEVLHKFIPIVCKRHRKQSVKRGKCASEETKSNEYCVRHMNETFKIQKEALIINLLVLNGYERNAPA